MEDYPKMDLESVDKAKKSLFGDFMFGRLHSPHTDEHKLQSPVQEDESSEEDSKTSVIHTEKNEKLKSIDTASGSFIITRVWDGCNMVFFRKRIKKRK
ncbi:hypothetical protein [Bacillus sp. MRMR6]|uniref:hypothetical protein n=1 Tax=Bacillus sp. MRMR6 TaxID=1928617 RepID=UPI00095293A3|nr:hypothetical protein [Bacillus sp. MRMR6]OLS35147.1 hypothetical protein BTR25_20430 [Bacillus sp. MRMR6]